MSSITSRLLCVTIALWLAASSSAQNQTLNWDGTFNPWFSTHWNGLSPAVGDTMNIGSGQAYYRPTTYTDLVLSSTSSSGQNLYVSAGNNSEADFETDSAGLWLDDQAYVQEDGTQGHVPYLMLGGHLVIGGSAGATATVQMQGYSGVYYHGQTDTNLYVGLSGNGTLTASGVAGVSPTTLIAGSNPGSTGTINVSGKALISTQNGNTYLGGTATSAGGKGVLNIAGVAPAISYITNLLKVWNTPGTSVSLSGGILEVVSLDTGGNPALFNWTGGYLQVHGFAWNAGKLIVPNGGQLSDYGGSSGGVNDVEVSSGGSFGAGLATSSLTFDSGSTFAAGIFNGKNVSTDGGQNNGYAQTNVSGQVTLTGSSLQLPEFRTTIIPGDTYRILTSSSPITGTFNGLPEGTVFQDTANGVSSVTLQISYLNNAVTLTVLSPEPGSLLLAAFGVVAVLGGRQRKG